MGAPIRVDDRLWGVMIAAARDEPLPQNVEARLAAFTKRSRELITPWSRAGVAR